MPCTDGREVIGLDVGEVESGSFWVEFLRGRASVSGVRRRHRSARRPQQAVARAGLPVQRCSVHFTRDMVMHCRRDQRGCRCRAQEIFQPNDRAKSGHASRRLAGSPGLRAAQPPRRPDRLLRVPRALTKIRSTNPLARQQEIPRHVVGSSPTTTVSTARAALKQTRCSCNAHLSPIIARPHPHHSRHIHASPPLPPPPILTRFPYARLPRTRAHLTRGEPAPRGLSRRSLADEPRSPLIRLDPALVVTISVLVCARCVEAVRL